jgi:hypothetical protein
MRVPPYTRQYVFQCIVSVELGFINVQRNLPVITYDYYPVDMFMKLGSKISSYLVDSQEAASSLVGDAIFRYLMDTV